jgi:8-oxo-dGTP diphosphatase
MKGGTRGSRRTYDWPRPAVTADVVVFTVEGALDAMKLKVLLVERGAEPHKGSWALPGGFVHEHEDLPAAAARELREETGLTDVYIEQVAAVGTPGRDPRGHTVTVVYVALVPADRHALQSTGDARGARWFEVGRLPPLAFDHRRLLDAALDRLRRRLGETPMAFALLPAEFTLSELQSLCEVILGRPLDRRNFRRKVMDAGFIAAARGKREGRHRPAQLYRFLAKAFERHTQDRGELPF